MDYLLLKIIHVTGLALTFMGLAGVLAGHSAGQTPLKKRWLFRAAHGGGLLIVLASGIALGLKLGVTHPAPFWILAKFGIWLLAGGCIALAIRFSRWTGILLLFFAALVFAAAWLALYKPVLGQ